MPEYANYRVEIEGTEGFRLDTDLLDTGLLGYLAQDVTEYVRSININSGRSNDQDKFTAGTMSVVFDNRTRMFDPDPSSGNPWYLIIKPRKKIVAYAYAPGRTYLTNEQFVGFIDDWSFSYDVSGESLATAQASDALSILATQDITLTSPPVEKSDARFRRVLTNSQVGWPLENFYSQGAAFNMNNASYSGNALEYLQSIAASEAGFAFVTQNGVIRFYGWNYFTGIPTVITFGYVDDTLFVPFTNIETVYGTEQLTNYATVISPAGTAISQDLPSQLENRITSSSADVLTSNLPEMQLLADLLISTYKEPLFRIDSLTVSIPGVFKTLGANYVDGLLDLDIGYSNEVTWKPNNIGGEFYRQVVIVGRKVSITPDNFDITYNFIPYITRSAY